MAETTQEAKPQFSQPIFQIIVMLIVMGMVVVLTVFAYTNIAPTFLANVYLNGFIAFVFLVGVALCFFQVLSLMWSVGWIEDFASDPGQSEDRAAPRLLVSLAALLRGRGKRLQIGSSSARSILDSIATRIDELREYTRYVTNTLIFLGLLGTFYGLATTVPSLVQTIQSLNPKEGEDALDIFARLQGGLEGQLDGMGIAFASSLLGLAGSLVVGLLEVFVGQAQNRFYRELEDWLSTITRVGFGPSDGESGAQVTALESMMDQMSEQMDGMSRLFSQSATGQAGVEAKIVELTATLQKLSKRMDRGQTEALERVAASQEQLVARMQSSGGEGMDAESRMRLRSMDVQMLRILEEISAGRQESISELRGDLVNLTKAVHQLGRAQQPPKGK